MKVRYYLGDDVRQEMNNKVSISGLYADNRLVISNNYIQETNDATKNGDQVMYFIDRLTLLINISEIDGEVELEGQFLDPNNNPHGDLHNLGKVKLTSNQSHNIIIQSNPFPFPKAGVYKFKLLINKEPEIVEFEIQFSDTH